MHDTLPAKRSDESGEPAWEIARLFPNQGQWTVNDYLNLDTNHLVEFTDGHVEVLPMPTHSHQLIVRMLVDLLRMFVDPQRLGEVLFAPLRVRVAATRFREPDVVFALANRANPLYEEFWEGADLVMEVVSEDNRNRDLQDKREDYARAGIPEYWIIDPRLQEITVLALNGGEYRVHGVFRPGEKATSLLLPGFSADVATVFQHGAARPRAPRD